ncbi:hypothetical protein LZ32DRAFT_609085 [Colletotrichum eremochloae]|nr:hypothetical protein LZ32DRAFT_609085 [Colletotrichum eremochloae]
MNDVGLALVILFSLGLYWTKHRPRHITSNRRLRDEKAETWGICSMLSQMRRNWRPADRYTMAQMGGVATMRGAASGEQGSLERKRQDG